MPTLWAEAASTHDSPASTVPAAISRRGPKRSIIAPWNGEKNVCSTISSENVTCNSESGTPSLAASGLVNRVQTYCGLEIAIMQTRPSNSCSQRVRASGMACGTPRAALSATVRICTTP
ncbi:hypothetical protein D3C86_1092040 [compost metagenome]